jgi:hypothetical protein
MTDYIKEIVNSIERALALQYSGKFYGLCEIVQGQGEIFPVTIATKRDRINPADTWQLQIYHRLLNSTRADSTEDFGKERSYNQVLRLVIISDVSMGESVAHNIANALPELIKVTGAYAVLEDSVNINTDSRSIASTEFGEAWDDKYQVKKNLYAVEYQITLTLCQ